MSKKTHSPAVMASHVKRQPRLLSQDDIDRDAVARHQAAQRAVRHTIDVIDATLAMKSAGPRTGTHPAAKTMSEAVDAILMKPQPPAILPTPVIHAAARAANSTLALVGAMACFMAGIALGKAL